MHTSGYQVQKDLGLSRGAVSNWRRGICQPSDQVVDLFCKTYHINKNWLVTGLGNMYRVRKTYSGNVQHQLKELRERIENLETEVVNIKKNKLTRL